MKNGFLGATCASALACASLAPTQPAMAASTQLQAMKSTDCAPVAGAVIGGFVYLTADQYGRQCQPGGGAAVSAIAGSFAVGWSPEITQLLAVAQAQIPLGTNRIGFVSDDPCAQATKLTAHFSSTSSGGNLITGAASKRTYICFLSIKTSATANISLCEATSTACTGGTPAAVYGNTGTTAANGANYQGGGENAGNGGYTIASTATAGQGVDVLFTTSNSPQVNVDVSYVQAP